MLRYAGVVEDSTPVQIKSRYRGDSGLCLATGIRQIISEPDIAGLGNVVACADIDSVQVGVATRYSSKR